MGLPIGWLLLLGGLLGTFRVFRAKTFTWMNEVDAVVTDEDRSRLLPMTATKRWTLMTVCFVAMFVGFVLVYRQHGR